MLNDDSVQVIIHSLPSAWDYSYLNHTHNDNFMIFDDVARRVELEKDRLIANSLVDRLILLSLIKLKNFDERNKRISLSNKGRKVQSQFK